MEPTSQPTLPNVSEVLNNVNFGDVINTLTNDPEKTTQLLEASSGLINEDIMEQARRHAVGPEGEKIKKEMQKQGVNNKAMLESALAQKKLIDEANNKTKGVAKKVVLITTSKQIKSKNIRSLIVEEEAKKLVGDDAIQISCSCMATGVLKGKTLKAWYSPKRKGRNPLASLIVGFDIAGELLLIMEEGDLLEKDVIDAKNRLK